jgi:hypothetical protein
MDSSSSTFSTDFAREAAFGTPVVAAAAWTMNDVLIYVSIAYVLLQTAYLLWKWSGEYKARKTSKAGGDAPA